jgi:uncharacterized protein (TIGR02284 family)
MEQSILIATLNDLLETCRDAHAGYQLAAHGLKDMRLKRALGQLALERKKCEEELRAEIERRGATAAAHGTVAGALHRGWLQVKELGRAQPATILEECARGEAVAIRSYREALAQDLPPEARQLVALQLDRISAARDHVLELRRSSATPETQPKS